MKKVTLLGSTQFDMASQASGRTYRIFIYKPATPPPEGGYPVVYTTDANLVFPLLATQAVAMAAGGGRVPIVIGIGYPTEEAGARAPWVLRLRDLTPVTPLSRIRPTPGMPPPSEDMYGGSAEFQGFLLDELRPAINARFDADAADQTLYGHSLGGLFVLQVLFSEPSAFRSYAASSPSIWWNRKGILKHEFAFARQVAAGVATPRVLIMAGAMEQEPPTTPYAGMTMAQMRRTLTSARMVDNARELAERLALVKGRAPYQVRYAAFDEEDHMSVIPASIGRTLSFALKP